MANILFNKALNIIYIHWIRPSNKIRTKALTKIQRWWRRGSGHHKGFALYLPCATVPGFPRHHTIMPGLWRQTQNCPLGQCIHTPKRIMKLSVQGSELLIQGKDTDRIKMLYRELTQEDEAIRAFKRGCACNWRPFYVYERMLESADRLYKQTLVKHARPYTKTIYYHLSQDYMHPTVRMRVSIRLQEFIKNLNK